MEEDLGSRIIRRRKYLGYSQEQLATAAGVSRQTVGRWENNVVTPKAENIAALCRILATDKDYFLSENSVRDNAESGAEQPPSSLVSAQPSLSESCAKRPSNKGFVIIAVTLTVLFIVFLVLTIAMTIMVLPINDGDKVSRIYYVDSVILIVLIVVTASFFIIDIIIILFALKFRGVNKVQT